MQAMLVNSTHSSIAPSPPRTCFHSRGKAKTNTITTISYPHPPREALTPRPPRTAFVCAMQQDYLETEVECVRRLRERARAEGAKVSTVEAELFEYEGVDMPMLVSSLKLLRSRRFCVMLQGHLFIRGAKGGRETKVDYPSWGTLSTTASSGPLLTTNYYCSIVNYADRKTARYYRIV